MTVSAAQSDPAVSINTSSGDTPILTVYTLSGVWGGRVAATEPNQKATEAKQRRQVLVLSSDKQPDDC